MRVLIGRKVEWFREELKEGSIEKVSKGIATFLEFGIGYSRFDKGVGSYSTAIIGLEDGEVKNIPVNMIKFNQNDGGM